MINKALLTRLPERTAIDIKSMTIKTDWDSAFWQLSAELGSDSALDLLDPTPDGPIEVEVNINDHLFNLQIESGGGSRGFGSRSRSVNGRSLTAQLAAPEAPTQTKIFTSNYTAKQIVDEELDNTGFSATMTPEDWLVPADVYSYNNKTPMQVIREVADACGAFILAGMATQTMAIEPRYKEKPWELDTATPDVIIPAAMCKTISYSWDVRPEYNGVYLIGEAGGISTRVIRDGSAGDKLAQSVTDKLMTATDPAYARARTIIGGSGKWKKYQLELPVFYTPTVPGIIQPGMLLQYDDTASSWIGVVTAVSVNAGRSDGVLKVRQTVDVERYLGD